VKLKMPAHNIKQKACRLVENLPEDATWDDLMYQIHVSQAIEDGLEDSEAGRTIGTREVRAKLGLL
jgi:predicted transcriptional regulator